MSDTHWNLQERLRRTTVTKHIGWIVAPHGWERWAEAVRQGAGDLWTSDTTFADMTRRLQPLTTLGAARAKRATGTSTTSDDFARCLQTTTDPAQIEKIQHEMYKQRHKIRRERDAHHWKTVLNNLRSGGWGKQAMERRRPRDIMTKLVDDNQNVERDRTKIQEAATEYYKGLFEDSSEENTKHDPILKQLTEQP